MIQLHSPGVFLHPHLSIWENQIWKCYHVSLSTIDNFELKDYFVTIIWIYNVDNYNLPSNISDKNENTLHIMLKTVVETSEPASKFHSIYLYTYAKTLVCNVNWSTALFLESANIEDLL
jgi:hypothetical protein